VFVILFPSLSLKGHGDEIPETSEGRCCLGICDGKTQ
jgi:hypothetical protein